MRARRIAPVLVLLAATFTPAATRADHHFYYLQPSQVNLTVMLPPPPDVASAQARSDEEEVAAAVAARSRSQLFEAEETSVRTVFFYEPAVGSGFTEERLPVTAAFFTRVGSDVKGVIDDAKAYWGRPRPDGAQKRRGSYPSGHAAFAAASAIVLAQLLPAKRDAIFTQARTFAENRIVLGVHYPSDIASGWTAGTLAAYVMMHDRNFQRDYAAAAAELHTANL
ncbi:MAG TPA: phosphatase PAP2 family protein [Candidatus Cybelea sp.]|jgi:acid phosphatase (class A)|nr:phosphatase PAP2 family protein [Candidatus Cybelea sp.]